MIFLANSLVAIGEIELMSTTILPRDKPSATPSVAEQRRLDVGRVRHHGDDDLGLLGDLLAVGAGDGALLDQRLGRRAACGTSDAPRRAPSKELIDKGAVACANGKEDRPEGRNGDHHGAGHAGRRACCSAPTASRPACEGKTVVDMSSISPHRDQRFAARINERGASYLDAPVSGGEVGAKAATLTIMVGGPEDAFYKVKPLFELMGKNIYPGG